MDVLVYIQRMEQGFNDHLEAIRSEQTNFRQWSSEMFAKVIRAQRNYGGTIPSGMVRMHRGEQARRNRHATAAAIEGVQAQQEAQLPQNQPNGPLLDAAMVPGADPMVATTPRSSFRPTRSMSPHAKLMDNIRSLSDMWEEFCHGHGDNKPAREFTGDEINGQGIAFKNKYSRRMKIWRVQCYLINQGFDIATANGMIARVYNTDKPTPIIIAIQREQKIMAYPFVGCQRFNPRLVAGRGGVIAP